jgi:hypothetical protein
MHNNGFGCSIVEAVKYPFSGIVWELFLHMQQSLNFSYTVVRPADRKWGCLDENGTWNGMMGMMVRKEADIALGMYLSAT